MELAAIELATKRSVFFFLQYHQAAGVYRRKHLSPGETEIERSRLS